jgi:hypothetical protein
MADRPQGLARSRYNWQELTIPAIAQQSEKPALLTVQGLKMASLSNLECIALCMKSASKQVKTNEEAKALLPCILIAFQQFKWTQPTDQLADRCKTNISRILLDAGFDPFKRSRYSTTAIKFSTKAITFHSNNKHIIAAQSAKDFNGAIKHLFSFAEEMNCARAFYRFKAWASSSDPTPLSDESARAALDFASGRTG